MPFKSKSQMRKFGAMKNKKEISKSTFDKWADETTNKGSLPEKLHKEAKTKGKKY
jgi:hypothetical protein